jgi:CheY-like chemotaxis protein
MASMAGLEPSVPAGSNKLPIMSLKRADATLERLGGVGRVPPKARSFSPEVPHDTPPQFGNGDVHYLLDANNGIVSICGPQTRELQEKIKQRREKRAMSLGAGDPRAARGQENVPLAAIVQPAVYDALSQVFDRVRRNGEHASFVSFCNSPGVQRLVLTTVSPFRGCDEESGAPEVTLLVRSSCFKEERKRHDTDELLENQMENTLLHDPAPVAEVCSFCALLMRTFPVPEDHSPRVITPPGDDPSTASFVSNQLSGPLLTRNLPHGVCKACSAFLCSPEVLETSGADSPALQRMFSEPLLVSGQETPSPELQEIVGPSRLRVLLVDDSPVQLRIVERMVRSIFKTAELSFTTASNLESARGRAQAQGGDFDLLICDLSLPDGNGAEFISEFCQQYPRRGTKILVVSGSALDDIATAIHAGGDEYLRKPVSKRSLLPILLRLLGHD